MTHAENKIKFPKDVYDQIQRLLKLKTKKLKMFSKHRSIQQFKALLLINDVLEKTFPISN